MLLSEIADIQSDEVLGIVYDGADVNPLSSIARMTFLAVFDGEDFDQDFIDTVIGYKSLDCDVGIEIPADMAVPVRTVLRIAAPMGLDVSLLPPRSPDEVQRYLDSISAYAAAVPVTPILVKPIRPVSDALGTMVRRRLEKNDAIPLALPERLVGNVDFDDILAATRAGFEKALGGPDAFDEYIDLHVAGIIEDSRRKLVQFVDANGSSAPN